jgi:hypothetical protein
VAGTRPTGRETTGLPEQLKGPGRAVKVSWTPPVTGEAVTRGPCRYSA